jgi:hypothetical protein
MTEYGLSERQEWARLLLDEWKFRQAHCWRLLQVYGLAAVIVSVAPYLTPDLRQGAGDWVIGFPVFGIVVGAVVMWLFSAEYQQCKQVLHKYRALQADSGTEYYPWAVPRGKGGRSIPIGVAIPRIFMLAFLVASIGNAFVLYMLNHPELHASLDLRGLVEAAVNWIRSLLGEL